MKRYSILMAALLPLLWSCEPQLDNVKLLDELVVSTNYDPDTFGDQGDTSPGYLTYALPTDTIGYVSNTDERDTIRVYRANFQYPRKVIDAVKGKMNDLGYTRVANTENPDIGVNIYVVSNLNLFQQVVYPSYYSGYYGYGGYYWYPYVQTYSYNTATLIVEWVDLKNRAANNKVKVVWNAYMGDVINSVDYEQQSVDAIRQAFDQSPYLSK